MLIPTQIPAMPTLVIRKAEPKDLGALKHMIGQLAAHHGDRATLDPEQLERDLFGTPPWIHAFVAENDAILVGYAILCPLYRAQFGLRGMDLHHLFVEPSSRGAGVGRRLIAAALDEARAQGCRYFNIGADADNLKAQAFYVSLGFSVAPAPGPRFRMMLA